METASSAWRTWSASSSAVEQTATVASPSSRHARRPRTAISPRFATRTLRNSGSLDRLERDDPLAGVHEILVLDQEARHAAVRVALDLVEGLHDLDQSDHVARAELVALGHVRIGLRA